MQVVISVAHVEQSYQSDSQSTHVLHDLNLEIPDGQFLALIGPSGCGKTTLINLLAGLDKLKCGTILIDGQPPEAGRPEVGYAPVRDSLLPWRRALDNAALTLEVQKVNKATRLARAREALGAMGLGAAEYLYPGQLSQGMRQRVALARLFASDPQVLLLDEPFSSLDAQTRVMVQEAFLKVWERKKSTVVLITHDLAEAVALADRVVVLSARPARIKAVHDIDLPRPRSAVGIRQNPQYHELFEAIWRELVDEVETADSAALRSEETIHAIQQSGEHL